MTEIKWIKVATDLFDDDKILLIEAEKQKDSIIVIWIKLLCLAGKQNNSGVFQIGGKPVTVAQFAQLFHRPVSAVKKAFDVFEEFGMIEVINGTVTIPKWDKHQTLDKADEIKEQNRKRVAEFRAKQKKKTELSQESAMQEGNADVTECNVTGNVTGNVTVTRCNAGRIRSKNIDTDTTMGEIDNPPYSPTGFLK